MFHPEERFAHVVGRRIEGRLPAGAEHLSYTPDVLKGYHSFIYSQEGSDRHYNLGIQGVKEFREYLSAQGKNPGVVLELHDIHHYMYPSDAVDEQVFEKRFGHYELASSGGSKRLNKIVQNFVHEKRGKYWLMSPLLSEVRTLAGWRRGICLEFWPMIIKPNDDIAYLPLEEATRFTMELAHHLLEKYIRARGDP